MDEGDVGISVDECVNPENVFTDTSVLLNYVQRGVEQDRTSALIDSDDVEIVIGVTVADELEKVRNRRGDIYADFLDYMLKENGKIDDYDPVSRRPYFQENDRQHVREIQMQLLQLDNRDTIQRRLRQMVRAAKRRLRYLQEEVVPEVLFDEQPGLEVLFGLNDVIANDNDRRVIGDAALWAAEENASSGIFVTMDKRDIIDAADDINAALREVKDEKWQLVFVFPSDVLIDLDTEDAATGDPD